MTETTQARPRSRFGGEFIKYLISALIIAGGAFGMSYLKTLATPPEDAASTALVQRVKTYDAQPYSGLLDIVVSGSVVPYREIKVAAEVGGTIKVKYDACQAGNYVDKGTPLIEIDPEEYELEIKTIEADVKHADTMIGETDEEILGAQRIIELAEDELQLQLQEYKRNKRLAGVLSNSEIDAAERGLLTSKSQLMTRKNVLDSLKAQKIRLEASLDLAKSRLVKSRLNLRRTTIVAPDDGIIVREMVEQGDYVSRGTQLFTFEDTLRAEVLCNLTASDLRWIRQHSTGSDLALSSQKQSGHAVYRLPKTAVSIYETGNPEVVWNGILERFDGIGRDELTKTIPCLIVVDKPVVDTPDGQRALVRGMYVKCRMEVQTSTAAADQSFLSFPELAMRPGNFVWVVRDDKLKRIDVQIADRTTGNLDDEIEPFIVVNQNGGELRSGDKIVLTPLSQPTDGTRVELEGGNGLTHPVFNGRSKPAVETAAASDEPKTS